jgi:hypothetical protein
MAAIRFLSYIPSRRLPQAEQLRSAKWLSHQKKVADGGASPPADV